MVFTFVLDRNSVVAGLQKLGGKMFDNDCSSMAAIAERATLRTNSQKRILKAANGEIKAKIVIKKLAQSITPK